MAGSALFILIWMTAIWILSVRARDASLVDRFWGLGFAVLNAGLFLNGPMTARGILVTGLVTVWALRLSGYIHARNRTHGEDPRYRRMRESWGPGFWWISYFTVFLLQGLLMWIIATPFMVIQSAPAMALGAFDLLGALLWLFGFGFEAVADAQLRSFKRRPENRGKIMTTGLWSRSRHPNYFGETVLWWGYFAFALAVGAPWTAISPVLMTFLLLKVSGVALLEKSMRNRPGFEAYARTTPAFFPRLF